MLTNTRRMLVSLTAVLALLAVLFGANGTTHAAPASAPSLTVGKWVTLPTGQTVFEVPAHIKVPAGAKVVKGSSIGITPQVVGGTCTSVTSAGGGYWLTNMGTYDRGAYFNTIYYDATTGAVCSILPAARVFPHSGYSYWSGDDLQICYMNHIPANGVNQTGCWYESGGIQSLGTWTSSGTGASYPNHAVWYGTAVNIDHNNSYLYCQNNQESIEISGRPHNDSTWQDEQSAVMCLS